MKKNLKFFWEEWAKPFLVVLAIMLPVRSAIGDWNDVPTGSMKPTILEGDRVVVNKIAYDLKVPFTRIALLQWGDPARGDIVVLDSPADGKRLVKRVIGMPGDLLELRENALILNGRAVPYRLMAVAPLQVEAMERLDARSHAVAFHPARPLQPAFGPIRVPSGHYFVMGDNRDDSLDSRFFGVVARKHIVGEAVAVAFSVDRTRAYRPRFERFFRALR